MKNELQTLRLFSPLFPHLYSENEWGDYEKRFREDGVNIDYLIVRVQPDILDKLIHQEQLEALWLALQSLPEDERSLIDELFFNEKSESQVAKSIGINQSTVSRRLSKILSKLKTLL